jgi:uncharacterized protein (TIGR02265 family)
MRPLSEPLVLQSAFEGLFVRALKVDDQLKARLRARGYDANRPEPKYALSVWEDCLAEAADHHFPGQHREASWPKLGHIVVDGFLETIVGRMISVTLPFLTPTRLINRLPMVLSSGIEGVTTTIEWETPTRVTIRLIGFGALAAWMLAGALSAMMEKLKAPGVVVTPFRLNERDGEMRVTLPAKS